MRCSASTRAVRSFRFSVNTTSRAIRLDYATRCRTSRSDELEICVRTSRKLQVWQLQSNSRMDVMKVVVFSLLALLSVASVSAANGQASPSPKISIKSDDPVFVGAGDIASCDDLAGAEATAKLIEKIPGTVFAAGDLAYPNGSDEDFAKCYGPTWGRFKGRTRPAPGNHEYHSDGASGYNRYFGAAAGDPKKGYYSYDLGAWHMIALNSECDQVGGCDAASAQGKWLMEDLAQHPAACTLAYFHKPLFSSGGAHGNDPKMKPLWDALYHAGADVVINGHDHDYERFTPQDPNGKPDAAHGIREFVVGSGGKNSHRKMGSIKPNSEVRND